MALPLKIDVLPEPYIEFANAGRHVDPRRGLAFGASGSDLSVFPRTLRQAARGSSVSAPLPRRMRTTRTAFATGRA
jgi:hypothetical protein